MADASGGARRTKPETLLRLQAAALIAQREPQMPIETIELALWRGIWRGEFDDDGLWLVELDGKARPYTRRTLAWQLAEVGVDDYRLGDFGYQPPPRDKDGLADLAKVEADWAKLAAWPLDAYGLLDVAFREAVVERLEVSVDALWKWWADEAKRLIFGPTCSAGLPSASPVTGCRRSKPTWSV
jgi:hypothetical protein